MAFKKIERAAALIEVGESDLENPYGSNSIPPRGKWHQRSLYNQLLYPESLPEPLDTWYGKIYYGRIDPQQNIIIPKTKYVSSLGAAATFGLRINEIVGNNFIGFVRHMQNAKAVGVLQTDDANSYIYDPKAYEGYVNPSTQYDSYIKHLFESFKQAVSPAQENRIVDFASFVPIFTQYLSTVAKHSPITQSAFVLTRLCNRFGSGLSIAIARGKPDEDIYKYREFLADPNFPFYVRCAKKYGFLVNKNAPWVLTADLFTTAFLERMGYWHTEDYQFLDEKNFFPYYFERTSNTDIGILKKFLVNAYNMFDQHRPWRKDLSFTLNPTCLRAQTKIKRPGIPPGEEGLKMVDTILTDKYLLNLYIDLRSIETKKPFRISKKFRYDAADAYRTPRIASLSKLQNAARWVGEQFRDYIYFDNYPFYASMEGLRFMEEGLDKTNQSDTMETEDTLAPPMGNGDSNDSY